MRVSNEQRALKRVRESEVFTGLLIINFRDEEILDRCEFKMYTFFFPFLNL